MSSKRPPTRCDVEFMNTVDFHVLHFNRKWKVSSEISIVVHQFIKLLQATTKVNFEMNAVMV